MYLSILMQIIHRYILIALLIALEARHQPEIIDFDIVKCVEMKFQNNVEQQYQASCDVLNVS